MNFSLSVKAFIFDNNKLLIIKRRSDDLHKPGIWEIPGGRLSLGEDPHQGLKREVKEETNLDIDIIKPLNVRHFKRDDNKTITMIIFICKSLNQDITLSDEHINFDWIDLNDNKLNKFFKQEVDLFKKFELNKYI